MNSIWIFVGGLATGAVILFVVFEFLIDDKGKEEFEAKIKTLNDSLYILTQANEMLESKTDSFEIQRAKNDAKIKSLRTAITDINTGSFQIPADPQKREVWLDSLLSIK